MNQILNNLVPELLARELDLLELGFGFFVGFFFSFFVAA
jgi:hypothetical protein